MTLAQIKYRITFTPILSEMKTVIAVVAFPLFLITWIQTPVVTSVFFGSRVQQVCVNAQGINPAALPAGALPAPGTATQTTCVKCDSNRLQYISALCTGQPTVPPTIAANQAFCLINNCLQQIPQKNSLLPSFGGTGMMGYAGNNMPLGRRRRRDSGSDSGAAVDEDVIHTSVVFSQWKVASNVSADNVPEQ